MSINVAGDRLLRPAEVAAWLSVSKSTLGRWRRTGEGPRCLWLAESCPRYKVSDVETWLQTRAA